jgi:hypothetical protein
MKYIFKFLFYILKNIYVGFYYFIWFTFLFILGVMFCIWNLDYRKAYFGFEKIHEIEEIIFMPQFIALHFTAIIILFIVKTFPKP